MKGGDEGGGEERRYILVRYFIPSNFIFEIDLFLMSGFCKHLK